MSPNFTPGITSETIVDDIQKVDPNRLRNWLKNELIRNTEDRECVEQLIELVDLADHSGFLNDIRQERMNQVADGMVKDAGM